MFAPCRVLAECSTTFKSKWCVGFLCDILDCHESVVHLAVLPCHAETQFRFGLLWRVSKSWACFAFGVVFFHNVALPTAVLAEVMPFGASQSFGEEKDKSPVAVDLEKVDEGAIGCASFLVLVTFDYWSTLLVLPSRGYRVRHCPFHLWPFPLHLYPQEEGKKMLRCHSSLRSCFLLLNGAANWFYNLPFK